MVEVQRWLAQVANGPVAVEETPTAFIADMKGKAAQGLILACDGAVVRGQSMRIEAHRCRMTFEDAANWLERRVIMQEELESQLYLRYGEFESWKGVSEVQAASNDREGRNPSKPATPERRTPSERRFPTAPHAVPVQQSDGRATKDRR